MRPEANSLILRHFHIGSEILQFVAANVPGVQIPMLLRTLEDLIDNVFLQHDLNLFIFIIRLNRELKNKGIEIQPQTQFDTDGVTAGPFDLETAIEIYTPLYQLFLTDNDFWRAMLPPDRRFHLCRTGEQQTSAGVAIDAPDGLPADAARLGC